MESSMTTDDLIDAGRQLFGERWQAALARRLGVDLSTIRRWRRGKTRVPTVAAIAIDALLRAQAADEALEVAARHDAATAMPPFPLPMPPIVGRSRWRGAEENPSA